MCVFRKWESFRSSLHCKIAGMRQIVRCWRRDIKFHNKNLGITAGQAASSVLRFPNFETNHEPLVFLVCLLAGQESFNSRSLALQAQKKILSKMATMVVANMLTDDTSSEILDELYKTSREFTKSKKEAHKIIKDVIKIALKIGILYRNHQFSPDELDTVERFKKKMNQAAMTAVSFYEVEYTFDRNILSELLLECRDLLHALVEQHLTARSHARIDHVFNHFAHGEFLAELYGDGEEYRLSLRKICNGINKLLDEGTL